MVFLMKNAQELIENMDYIFNAELKKNSENSFFNRFNSELCIKEIDKLINNR